jgi:hypothetical protein
MKLGGFVENISSKNPVDFAFAHCRILYRSIGVSVEILGLKLKIMTKRETPTQR